MSFLFGGGQNAAAKSAAQQENNQTMLTLQQSQNQALLLQQQQAANAASTAASSKSLSSQIGDPVQNPTNIAAALGYGSNSPIFSTSSLKTGRNTLLGN